jgi:hypothetical protein
MRLGTRCSPGTHASHSAWQWHFFYQLRQSHDRGRALRPFSDKAGSRLYTLHEQGEQTGQSGAAGCSRVGGAAEGSYGEGAAMVEEDGGVLRRIISEA